MTLDIAKFISNSIKMQAKIQHLDINTETVEKDSIPESVSKLITKAYGKKYLLDSDYVSFFWGGIDKDDIKKLFNVVDKALGKSANKLTDTDFKKIDISGSSSNNEDAETESDDDKDEVEDIEDEVEDIVDEEPDENFDAEEEIEDDKSLNEDEDEIDIEVKEESPSKPTAYFFLKITLK